MRPWHCPICGQYAAVHERRDLRWLDTQSGEIREEPVCAACGPQDALPPHAGYGRGGWPNTGWLTQRQRTKKH